MTGVTNVKQLIISHIASARGASENSPVPKHTGREVWMGRKPPLSGKKSAVIKPERARKLIRKFHVLLKTQAAARAAGNLKEVTAIDDAIRRLGGLETYQQASICGQSNVRGGDSSIYLVEWLPPDFKGSLLEVGCLKVDNACAKSNRFGPHDRIDLNSQHPQIQQQDFMTMKRRRDYDVISLSLVVNYVPDAGARGAMLKRAHAFLKPQGKLFFVLPRACVDNSRYCNDEVVSDVFKSVGLAKLQERKTAKLVYWLLAKEQGTGAKIAKRKVRDSPGMNNFSIVIE